MSNFPSSLDVLPTLVDNVDTVDAQDWNDMADAIVAIETAIGAQLSLLVTAGEIRKWSGSIASIPSGWLHCDGAAVSRNTYVDLFALIGTQYGVGDGSTTFNLPNFDDKFPVGAKQDSSGVAKSNLEGSLYKSNSAAVTQPATTGPSGASGAIEGGPNDKLGNHTHTFTPPFIALVYMIKT